MAGRFDSVPSALRSARTVKKMRPYRQFAATALLVLSELALAQAKDDYPARPIRVVVVYGAGGGLDIVTRIVADPLTHALGRQVVVENRPGAGGNIGTELVSRAAPD